MKNLSLKIEKVIENHKIQFAVGFLLLVIFIDLFGIDSYFYRVFCLISSSKLNPEIVCPNFYDIPIWSFFGIYGVIATVIVAVWAGLIGINQANKQEVLAQKLQKDDFLPILVPVFENNIIYKNGSINIKFKNVGKGIAKNIVLYFGKFKLETGVSLAPDNSVREYNPTSISLEEIFDHTTIPISYEYEDIYDRTHKTIGVEFRLDGNDKFVPHSANWKFVKNNG